MKFEVGDLVVLFDGSEVRLEKDCGGLGFMVRHTLNSKREQIRNEMIREKALPRPASLWEDLAQRMQQDVACTNAPAALIAAVKVDRKVQYLPSYGAINAIPFLFQYTPLFALRRSPWGRILVADETGLGKTVEAGIVLEELFRSQDPAEMITSALVIGPKSLQAEWENKLLHHFERTVDAINLQDLVKRLSGLTSTDQGEQIHYLSMDALPGLLKHRDLMEGEIPPGRLYDIVIVDEAHHFKNPESKRRRALARLLGEKLQKRDLADPSQEKLPKLLMLTATPLSTSLENLFSYFTLMDPALSTVYGIERQQLAFKSEHRRVVLARSLSNFVFRLYFDPTDVDTQARLKGLLANPQHRALLLEVESDHEAASAFETLVGFSETPTNSNAEELAEALLNLDPWCDMVVRNTRRGVELQENTKVLVDNRCVQLYADEIRKANKVPFWNMEPLAQVSYRQMLASSIPGLVHRDAIHALAKTAPDAAERIVLDAPDEDEEAEPLVFEDNEGDFQSQPLSLPELLSLPDAKFESLLEALEQFFGARKQGGGLLFTRFTATGSYLFLRLRHEAQEGGRFPGLRVEYIHGRIKAEDRAKLIEELKRARGEDAPAPDPRQGRFDGAHLIILTEVGQEGIDLQFCTGVFHYDLPWNPMRLVQRNGRVHRIGQRSPEVYIHTFFVDGSLDMRISQAIALRMQMVYDTFGDLPDGLFGGETGESLRECGIEGHILLQDLLRGRDTVDFPAELARRVVRIEQETTQIHLHREQIQKLLTDEAETCQAWKPMVQEALHGSFGSLERVLRSDVEALLRWSTVNGRNVTAQILDTDQGQWDLQWKDRLNFNQDRTGAMGKAARRALATRNQMIAQVLPDDGKSRMHGLEPFQVLHVAHPVVAAIATQTLKDFQRPLLLVGSGATDQPCALVCLEFEIKDGSSTRSENRWFLMEPTPGQSLESPWRRLAQRGSAERVKAILADTQAWKKLDLSRTEAALKGLLEGMEELHLGIAQEETDRKSRFEIKRRVRHLRHISRVLDYWSLERRERESHVNMMTRHIERMEIGEISDIELESYRRRLPSAKGELTKASRELNRLLQIQERLEGEVAQLRLDGYPNLRVSVFDQRPDALMMIQPESL